MLPQPLGKPTFPHPEGTLKTAGITVENSHFSTFSTAFSTGVFHREKHAGGKAGVYIIVSTPFDGFPIFPALVFFTNPEPFVQKIPS